MLRLSLRRATATVIAALAALVAVAAMLAGGAGASTAWLVGDVFAGTGGGKYNVYDNSGVFKETIDSGVGGFTTGCSFNPALDKLYTTEFIAGKVVVFNDASPHAIALTINTATQGGAAPESVVFAANGDFYVGHADGDADIQRFNAAGVYQQSFDVAVESPGRGSDWIDLAADQKTMFYTSEGRLVKRYDVSTSTQLADFATLPGTRQPFIAYALRLLPPGDGTGGLIVADQEDIKRLDGAGAVVQTYDVAGDDSWFSLNLDPNGTSFWAGSFGTNTFYRFNIASGAVEVGPIASGGTLFGLCVKGELTAAAAPDLQITKSGPVNAVIGGQISYTLNVKNNGPSNATNVVVSDLAPLGTTVVSAVASQGSCNLTVSCNLGALANGAGATVTIMVTAAAPGTVTNTGSVSADEPDPDPSNNSASATTNVYGFAPGGGSFVVGNQTATGAVTFWGAQWWKLNVLSGGAAPAAFKGYALNPTVPSCGTGWSTDPGNSAPPPAGPLPAYMAVIVASKITKSGSQISGDTARIIIVKTNPGYSTNTANPGHAGTGTFFAKIC